MDPKSEPRQTDLAEESVLVSLSRQLRLLLSRQNISVDPSVALVMSGAWQNPSSISIDADALLRHPIIARYPVDREGLLDAAEKVGPHVLRVDREAGKIYPVMKAERSTLILRDLKTTEQALRDFIAKAPCLEGHQSILEVRVEEVAGTHWFITLPTAQDATETALWLRGQTFEGQSLKVAVKSESEFQSFIHRPPQQTFSVEGAFVPAMGLPFTHPRRGRGGYRSRPWAEDNRYSSHRPSRGTRGARMRPGGRRIIMRDSPNETKKEVDPSDFPPLGESAKLSSVGYGTRPFRQYTPEALRAIFQTQVQP